MIDEAISSGLPPAGPLGAVTFVLTMAFVANFNLARPFHSGMTFIPAYAGSHLSTPWSAPEPVYVRTPTPTPTPTPTTAPLPELKPTPTPAPAPLPEPKPTPAPKPQPPSGPITGHEPSAQWPAPPPMTIDPGGKYTAMLATSDGMIGVELLPKVAPNAVNNFVFLAEQGFYKRVPIHRMLPGFMFQSGDPTGSGTGGPGYDLPDDPVPANLRYERGVLAMANTGMPNSGGSQFFIMLDDYPLPPTYTIFGKVTSGDEVLDRIAQRPVTDNGSGEPSKPVDPIGIHEITITRDED